MEKNRKILFSISSNSCRWDYYRGSGKGGQKRNKTENCARCTHFESGFSGKSEDGRSKTWNQKKAFERLVNSVSFQNWANQKIVSNIGHQRKFSIEVEEKNQGGSLVALVFDHGRFMKPIRKKVKRRPSVKNPNKTSRQDSKKRVRDY